VGDYGVASPQELVKIKLGDLVCLMIKGGDASYVTTDSFVPDELQNRTCRSCVGFIFAARASRHRHPSLPKRLLNEKRRGRLTWRRIEDALDYKERALIVELYGPVFGEEPIEVAADETLGKPDLMQDDDFAVPEGRVEDKEPLPIF
jgi:hypothetical protein